MNIKIGDEDKTEIVFNTLKILLDNTCGFKEKQCQKVFWSPSMSAKPSETQLVH